MSRLGMGLGGLGSLLHRHGDLSSNLWDPRKSRGVVAHVCKPCGKREEDSGAHWPGNLDKISRFRFRDRSCLKGKR